MRKARQLTAGAVYHVTARTNKKEILLDSPLAKTLFLETLLRALSRYPCQIDNFCIMGNHFHLLIRPRDDVSLADVMKWVLGVYTMAHNRVYRQWGHVWRGRYYSRPVATFAEYREVFRYIDQNPVKAGLVENAEVWSWGGLAHHLLGRTDIVTAPLWWRGLVASEPLFRKALVQLERTLTFRQ